MADTSDNALINAAAQQIRELNSPRTIPKLLCVSLSIADSEYRLPGAEEECKTYRQIYSNCVPKQNLNVMRFQHILEEERPEIVVICGHCNLESDRRNHVCFVTSSPRLEDLELGADIPPELCDERTEIVVCCRRW